MYIIVRRVSAIIFTMAYHEILTHIVLMLGQRRRRRTNIETTVGQRHVFASMLCFS